MAGFGGLGRARDAPVLDRAGASERRCRHHAGTLVGEGGDAMTPIMVKLLHDDAAGLAPDFGSYTNVDLDQGIADFVGTAPGTFGTDFAVTERPLTTAEAAAAKANGRSFAYVPDRRHPGGAHDAGAELQPTQGSSTIARHNSASTSRSRLDQLGRHLRGRPPPYQVGATAG